MKRVYIIGGTMGVGKTTVCQALKRKLDNSVFLDGDWCWDSHPFQVNDATKKTVVDNICAVLNNFIDCPAYDNVIFCWVMHMQEVIDEIVTRLNGESCRIISVSLVCSEKVLAERLRRDIENGLRTEDVIERSVSRILCYDVLDTEKIDTTALTVEETVKYLSAM